jgi:hypothetical protein
MLGLGRLLAVDWRKLQMEARQEPPAGGCVDDPLHSLFRLFKLVCCAPLVVVHLMLEIAYVGHQLQDLGLQGVVSEDADFALKRGSLPRHCECTRGTVTVSAVLTRGWSETP